MRKALKISLYVITGIFLILLGLVCCVNSKWGQAIIRHKTEAYLTHKLKTEVHIGYLGMELPKYIVIKDVLMLDRASDTLLSVGFLQVDIAMMGFIHKKVAVQQIVLTGVHSHIYRSIHDTDYNFTYIINAFSSNTPVNVKTPTNTSSSLSFSVEQVRLNDIHFHLNDVAGGMQLSADLDTLDLKMEQIDLAKQLFHIKDLNLAGMQVAFSKDTSYLAPSKTPTQLLLKLIADNVHMQRASFHYNDNLSKMLIGIEAGELALQLNKLGLDENIVDVKKLVTKNTSVILAMNLSANAKSTGDSMAAVVSSAGWRVEAADVSLENVNYKMDDTSKARQALGIDYLHLNLQNAALAMTHFSYKTDTISGSIQHFKGTEQCGLDVVELRTDFSYNLQGAILDKLYFQTPNTILQDHIEVHYPSVAAIVKREQLLQLNLHVINSISSVKDLLIFAPQLSSEDIFKKFRNERVKVEGSITGTLNDMNIAHFYAAAMGNTEVLLSGRVGGMPEVKDLSYNLNIVRFHSSRKDIAQLVPDSVLARVRLPDEFDCNGLLSGTMDDYETNMHISSTDGKAYLKGLLVTSKGKNNEKYDMLMSTDALNIGRILKKDSMLGAITAAIKVKGKSFDVHTISTVFDGSVSSAFVNGYRYHDIVMSGNILNMQGDINFQSADSNMHLLLTGHGDFNNEYAAINADITIDSIDFMALKLFKTELHASGAIHIAIPSLNPDYPGGKFTWLHPIIVTSGKRYLFDSLYIQSNSDSINGQNLYANFDVATMAISGKTPLTKLSAIFQEHFNRHNTFAVKDSADNGKTTYHVVDSSVQKTEKISSNVQPKKDTVSIPAIYDLALSAVIMDKPILHSLFPGLMSFDSIHVDGTIAPRTLLFNASLPNLVYSSTTVQNARAAIQETDSELTYSLTADQLYQNNLVFWFADVHGTFDEKFVTSSISLSDSKHKERFALAATMQSFGNSKVIRVQPGLKLNYKTWAVAQPNRIVLEKGGFFVDNFEVSDSSQFIKAVSAPLKINSPLKIDISNFDIANITDVLSSSDSLLAEGLLSGNITIQAMTPALQITSDVAVKNLVIMKDTLGDMQVQVSNKTAGKFDTKLVLTGQGNDITLSGPYYLQPQNGNDFNFNLDVKALKLKSFETIAQNEIQKSSGFIRGGLKIRGKMTAPDITGELHTDNLVTTVTRLNAEFKMPAEKITFSSNDVIFNNFAIMDAKGNKATITGDIGTKNLPQLDFNVTVAADKWQALHATVNDNKEYYGDLILTSQLSVKGTSDAPHIDGTLNVLKGTKLTVVNPQTEPQLQSTKGIVEFVNMRDTARSRGIVVAKKDSVIHRFATGTDINVNITVPKEAEFTLIIDQLAGDFLTVHGEAFLNTAVTPGGVVTLSGNYALHGGAYQLNYNFIKRKFLIQDGSNITFAGDPIKGTIMDVTAVYESKIPPYDLVMQQVSDPVQLNYFKQILPFNVDLHLKGVMLQPDITFDIQLPENKIYPLSPDQIELVQGRLNQLRADTTSLNKQVFAVLILGRFVSENPLSSSTSLNSTAMSSVSTFIGEQLNQAASKLITGVDISADLSTTDDYTTGSMRSRTDLNIAASKRLMNDRLKITVGNDFELAGPQTTVNQQSGYVPNNLSTDYLLTSDGRYIMQAYRKYTDEGVLEGFVTQTGLNFIVSLDYDNFRKSFMRSKTKDTTQKKVK